MVDARTIASGIAGIRKSIQDVARESVDLAKLKFGIESQREKQALDLERFRMEQEKYKRGKRGI